MSRVFNLGDLAIPANDINLNGFAYNDIVGWYGVDGVSDSGEARPNQHGRFVSDSTTLASVVVSISGIYEGKSYEDAVRAKRLLTKQWKFGQPIIVSFYDDVLPTWREVFITRIVPVHSHGNSYFTWAADMVTTETPFRYGITPDVQSTGLYQQGVGILDPITSALSQGSAGDDGRATATNTGDYPSWQTFRVQGGLSGGFQIVRALTGQTIELDRQIPDNSIVTVDSESGRITIDGDENDISGQLVQNDWWTIDPGVSEEIQFVGLGTATGTPTLTVTTPPIFL